MKRKYEIQLKDLIEINKDVLIGKAIVIIEDAANIRSPKERITVWSRSYLEVRSAARALIVGMKR